MRQTKFFRKIPIEVESYSQNGDYNIAANYCKIIIIAV
jgi:hypothetical protein